MDFTLPILRFPNGVVYVGQRGPRKPASLSPVRTTPRRGRRATNDPRDVRGFLLPEGSGKANSTGKEPWPGPEPVNHVESHLEVKWTGPWGEEQAMFLGARRRLKLQAAEVYPNGGRYQATWERGYAVEGRCWMGVWGGS